MIRNILLIAMLVSGGAFAQRGGGGGRGGNMGAAMPMSMMSQSRLDRFATTLDLSKDQKKEVKSMMDESQKEASPLREQLSKSRLAIGEAVHAGKTGADLDAVLKANADIEAQMAAIEARAFAKLFASLEKEQQAKVGPVFAMMKGIFAGKNWNNPE